jgi:hypothetical protein
MLSQNSPLLFGALNAPGVPREKSGDCCCMGLKGPLVWGVQGCSTLRGRLGVNSRTDLGAGGGMAAKGMANEP